MAENYDYTEKDAIIDKLAEMLTAYANEHGFLCAVTAGFRVGEDNVRTYVFGNAGKEGIQYLLTQGLEQVLHTPPAGYGSLREALEEKARREQVEQGTPP